MWEAVFTEAAPQVPALCVLVLLVLVFLYATRWIILHYGKQLDARDKRILEIVAEARADRQAIQQHSDEAEAHTEDLLKECSKCILLNSEELERSREDRHRDRERHEETLKLLGACSSDLNRATRLLDQIEKGSGLRRAV